MGQSWWWVVPAVVVIALLVAVVLLRTRRRRVTASSAANVEIAAAAAGGAAGAVGAAAVAAVRAEKDTPELDESAPGEPEERAAGGDVADRPTDPPDELVAASAPADAAVVDAGGAEADERSGSTDPVAEIGAAADSAGAAEPDVFENEPAASAREEDGAAPSIPAPREELPTRSTEHKSPEPADSALAALDSGLVGPTTSFAATAAAAVTASPGPYPGSLLPAADGTSPSPVHQIKANEGSRRYHTPESPYYVRTRGDAWFRTAEEARAAGFRAWDDQA